jgi:hypothetical protein
MPLLFDDDYEQLRECGITYEECESDRFFIFTQFTLPDSLYTVATCDILVVIPPNYNQDGNDMFWTFPRLYRADCKPIPAVLDPAGGDNRILKGKEYCRWSRHWQSGPGMWRPGRDDIISIYRRIVWALQNPDC